jgi:hypothetical protein
MALGCGDRLNPSRAGSGVRSPEQCSVNVTGRNGEHGPVRPCECRGLEARHWIPASTSDAMDATARIFG